MFKKIKKCMSFLITVFMTIGLLAPINVQAAKDDTLNIQIIATNDTHVKFFHMIIRH